jgi:hypothetical protein
VEEEEGEGDENNNDYNHDDGGGPVSIDNDHLTFHPSYSRMTE